MSEWLTERRKKIAEFLGAKIEHDVLIFDLPDVGNSSGLPDYCYLDSHSGRAIYWHCVVEEIDKRGGFVCPEALEGILWCAQGDVSLGKFASADEAREALMEHYMAIEAQ